MIRIRQFAHIMVPTEEFSRTVAFYRDILGFTEMPVPPTGYIYETTWLRAEGVELHIVARDENLLQAETERHPEHPATFNPTLQLHLAFEVESTHQAIRTLKAEGVDYTTFAGEGPTSRHQLFFRDPSGTMLELYEISEED